MLILCIAEAMGVAQHHDAVRLVLFPIVLDISLINTKLCRVRMCMHVCIFGVYVCV